MKPNSAWKCADARDQKTEEMNAIILKIIIFAILIPLLAVLVGVIVGFAFWR